MAMKTITVRVDDKKVKALDKASLQQRRNRSFVLNEAVDYYLSMQQHYADLILKGIEDDDAGRHVSHEEIVAELRRRTAKNRGRKKAS